MWRKQIAVLTLIGLVLNQSGSCQIKEAEKKQPAQTQQSPPVNGQQQSEERKKMDMLINKILDKDPTAILMAKQLGSFASSEIKHLTKNEDEVVREIAVRCLNQTGGSNVEQIFVDALSDPSPTVRAAALNGLNNHLSEESYPKLLQTYQKVADPQHRKEITRLLGRIGGADLNDLRQICRNEDDRDALEGCRAALAKLGDPQARTVFLDRLRRAKNLELKDLLEQVDYIKQLWALRGLIPVLADKTPLTSTGICQLAPEKVEPGGAVPEKADQSPAAEYLRACDIALNLIAKIAGVQFSFPVSNVKNYTDEQLSEARRFLETLP